jgi:hypothetical protein
MRYHPMLVSVLTHWETVTYFMKLPPLPKSRALLGARNELLGFYAASGSRTAQKEL